MANKKTKKRRKKNQELQTSYIEDFKRLAEKQISEILCNGKYDSQNGKCLTCENRFICSKN